MTEERRRMYEERANDSSTFIKTSKSKKKKEPEKVIETPIVELPVEVVVREWDVSADKEINYFDADLSYELTGYRPITAVKSLDFDIKEFTKPALNYLLYGKYTNFVPKTLAYNKYWQEEVRRCREGYTVGRYTLTGYNYFYLNYYRIQSAVSLPGQELRDYTFPSFINKQYEYFHYIEMCKKTGKDCLAFKGRGIGASEIAAAIAACEYTVHKASRSVVTACAQSLVEKTLNKIWLSLDFLDSCTENAFRHQRMKIDTALFKRASTLTSEGIELGWRSEIEGITADQPRKLRGDRCNLLFFEEAGTNKNLVDTYIESEALVNIGGQRIGTKLVFGTSDSSGPTLAGLKKMFYNPTEYNILPYKNIYMRDGKIDFTGYFIPSFSVFYGDNQGDDFYNRGIVNEIVAKEYYRKMINSMKDPHDALRTRAEYCFTPEDGFILEGENRFNQEALVNLLSLLENTDSIPKPQRCRLYWLIKDGELNRDAEPQFEYTPTGKILIAEMPIKDEETNLPIKNLYIAGTDGIDSDSYTSTGLADVSQFCIVIFKRNYGIQPPKIVALYKDRPRDIKEAYDNALKLCRFYNCQMCLEATRVGIVSYFRQYHKEHYFMRRPQATYAGQVRKVNRRQIGFPATPDIINHALELIEFYINDYCEQILFKEVLDEAIRYSYENKRKFDIIAAWGAAMLGNEELMDTRIRPSRETFMKLQNFGWYTDATGARVFGIINDNKYEGLELYSWIK